MKGDVQRTHSILPWLEELLPRVLPVPWKCDVMREDGCRFIRPLNPRNPNRSHMWTVIVSGATEQDGRRWVHLSTVTEKRLPSWPELVEVRDVFLPGKKCIQVIAPPSEHVNIHPHCLHLWHCIDGDVLPDFTQGSGSL